MTPNDTYVFPAGPITLFTTVPQQIQPTLSYVKQTRNANLPLTPNYAFIIIPALQFLLFTSTSVPPYLCPDRIFSLSLSERGSSAGIKEAVDHLIEPFLRDCYLTLARSHIRASCWFLDRMRLAVFCVGHSRLRRVLYIYIQLFVSFYTLSIKPLSLMRVIQQKPIHYVDHMCVLYSVNI